MSETFDMEEREVVVLREAANLLRLGAITKGQYETVMGPLFRKYPQLQALRGRTEGAR